MPNGKNSREDTMKKTISLISCVWLVLLFNTAQATIQTAEEVVMSTADAVLVRLTAEREALDADPGKIYNLVNEVVIPHFDFISMSKWVWAKKAGEVPQKANGNSLSENSGLYWFVPMPRPCWNTQMKK